MVVLVRCPLFIILEVNKIKRKTVLRLVSGLVLARLLFGFTVQSNKEPTIWCFIDCTDATSFVQLSYYKSE
jgi:hypothetical protein